MLCCAMLRYFSVNETRGTPRNAGLDTVRLVSIFVDLKVYGHPSIAGLGWF